MTKFYDLKDQKTVEAGDIATAALITCGLCADVIDSMGGPGNGAICERCGDELKRGVLRGCVVWEDKL